MVLMLILAAPSPARADVLSEMENFWRGAAVNTTGPTAFQGQASGHWTLGNLYLRAPVRSESIATVSLPSYRAGCGGIDAFAGRFFLHRFRPDDRLRPRRRAERGGLRLRTGARDHIARDRRDHVEAACARPVGEQPERKLMRDGASARRRRLVEERPRERRHLRRGRDAAGDFFGLRRRAPRLRRGRETQFDPGGRNWPP